MNRSNWYSNEFSHTACPICQHFRSNTWVHMLTLDEVKRSGHIDPLKSVGWYPSWQCRRERLWGLKVGTTQGLLFTQWHTGFFAICAYSEEVISIRDTWNSGNKHCILSYLLHLMLGCHWVTWNVGKLYLLQSYMGGVLFFTERLNMMDR
jgi:hypothetical protein